MFHVNIDGVLHPSDNLPPTSTNTETIKRRKRRKRSKMNENKYVGTDCFHFPLAPLTVPFPVVKHDMFPEDAYYNAPKKSKSEGKTPMRYNDNTAIASVTVQKSDAAVQREYFLKRLDNARWPKSSSLEKLFNIHAPQNPASFLQLIDMIKNDKFKINKKAQKKMDELKEEGMEYEWFYGPMYGFEWDMPAKADMKGYDTAIEKMEKQMNIARDTIMSGDAAAMAKAVADFEAWTPTVETAH